MKVYELIAFLQDLPDHNATVLLMNQDNWPFEYSVRGACTRADVREEYLKGHDKDDPYDPIEEGTAISDVFLVEGKQLRYGNKAAWRYLKDVMT